MKKIDYNQHTHEINIIKIKKSTWIKRIGKFLNKYKIFIIVIPSFFLTIMSVLISAIGVMASIKSTEIYNRQLEILENDREPHFTIECNHSDQIFEGSDYNYTKKEYTIKNEGGLITGTCMPEIYTYIFIKVSNTETSQKYTYILYLNDIFEEDEVFSLYDINKKEFKFYKRESDKVNKLIPELETQFKEIFFNTQGNKYTLEAYIYDCIEIEYINYQNIEFKQKFQLKDENRVSLAKIEEDIENAYIIGSISIEENFNGFGKSVCGLFKNTIRFSSNEEALDIAKRYLSTFTYSYEGLIEQLYLRDIFSYDNAVYAADHCGADWNEQAIKTAENYLRFKPYSYNKLLEILTLDEKFTHDQAIYGIKSCKVDWNEQARKRIELYIHSNESYSYDKLLQLLKDEGYTYEQAVYGIEHTEYQNK